MKHSARSYGAGRRKVLIVAFNFPPMSGTSAAQRTLSLCRYLPDHGWLPIVLCPQPYAYSHTDPSQLKKVPANTLVRRSAALDAGRHLGVRGRHLPLLDVPDRWSTWWLSAVPAGLGLVRRYKPDVMLSTFPIATAHLIGMSLHRLTGVPWISDFRDVMVENDYPSGTVRRPVWQWIERNAVTAAARSVFTTPGAARLYAQRYPEFGERHWQEIGNAFDEGDFKAIERQSGAPSSERKAAPMRLVHSGILYPQERDPRALFEALRELIAAGRIEPQRLRIVLRGARYDGYSREQIKAYGLEELVSVEPVIPYSEALREMLEADGLLLLQGSVCNNQVPAKVYEYLRARRPILALTDEAGDTAALLREGGIHTIAALSSREAIADLLPRFLQAVEQGTAPVAGEEFVRRHTREARVAAFARLLDEVAGQQAEGLNAARNG